jgi:hypothetical protein
MPPPLGALVDPICVPALAFKLNVPHDRFQQTDDSEFVWAGKA